MSTRVSYKGNDIATVTNNTKTLLTQGKYLEANVILIDTSLDVSDTTATADNVAAGLYFYTAAGVKTVGTLINGNNLGYGYTDGGLPLAGVAQAGYASAADPTLPAMSLGTGIVGTDRVV